jgi:hypothetical protein
VFTPVLAKHSKSFSLIDCISVGVDRMQRKPKYEKFRPRTIWSLSNAFTSAFKELDPIRQFRATAKLGEFLDAEHYRSTFSTVFRAPRLDNSTCLCPAN